MRLLWFGLASLPQRAYATAVVFVSVAGVVLIMTSVFAISYGLKEVFDRTASPDAVVVMNAGSLHERDSWLRQREVRRLLANPNFERRAANAVAAMELVDVVNLPGKSSGTNAHVDFRGVQPASLAVRDGFRLVAGRLFEPGRHEAIAGVGARDRFEGLAIGDTVRVRRTDWTVVGHFSAGGAVAESEVWADFHLLDPISGMTGWVHTVHARVTSPEARTRLAGDLAGDESLRVDIRTYADFFGDQADAQTETVETAGLVAAILMGLCATFGAVNTMFAAVAARRREMAVLRTLGFGGVSVGLSVVVESVVVAVAGGASGGLVAYALLDGLQASTQNLTTFSQVAFSFQVTPELIALAVGYAAVVGLAGGLPPALHAARAPIVGGLRSP